MEPVLVTVCSADQYVVLGVEHLLADVPGFAVVPRQRSGEARIAIVVCASLCAEALDLLTRVSRTSSAAIVLIIDQLDEEHLPELVQRRVVGVIARGSVNTETLLATLNQSIESASSTQDLVQLLMTQLDRVSPGVLQPKTSTISMLSRRERDLLKLLADGLDTTEIARTLAYSERTIKYIVHNMLTRLELRNRAHAVAFAMRAGAL